MKEMTTVARAAEILGRGRASKEVATQAFESLIAAAAEAMRLAGIEPKLSLRGECKLAPHVPLPNGENVIVAHANGSLFVEVTGRNSKTYLIGERSNVNAATKRVEPRNGEGDPLLRVAEIVWGHVRS